MRRAPIAIVPVLLTLLAPPAVRGHIGSPDVFYEGLAGPYRLLVRIQPPDVVPGLAAVTARVDQDDVTRVTLSSVYFSAGKEGAPRPDVAERSQGDPHLFAGQLWLMEFGSSAVIISVAGGSGSGEIVVPVPARATSRRVLGPHLGLLLAGLGLLLVSGAVAIVGAASREGTLSQGAEPTPHERSRGRRAMLVTTLGLLLLLVGGQRWWERVDGGYLRRMYRPTRLETSVSSEGGQVLLRLRLVPAAGPPEAGPRRIPVGSSFAAAAEAPQLLPDHGKLMHLFLVGEPSFLPFAHLHPVMRDDDTFESILPPLSGGRYRVFADIVHENGLAETLTSEQDLPTPSATSSVPSAPASSDPDDSWAPGPPGAASQALQDGSRMTFALPAGQFQAGEATTLRFSLTAPDGHPASLEPYMGMPAHAVILRDDGSVFVHLHPVGTVPMAAQAAFAHRVGEAEGMTHAAPGDTGSEVSFPYAFPMPGHYRIFVQVKRQSRILTGIFDAAVSRRVAPSR